MSQKCLEHMTRQEKTKIIEQYGCDRIYLLKILTEMQKLSCKSCIDEDTAFLVADELEISHEQIMDVITFYAMLEDKPRGRYVLEICNSAPCYYSKSDDIARFLCDELEIGIGETTTDGLFTICYTPCVGACDIGPVIKIEDSVHRNLTSEKIKALLSYLCSAQ